MDMADRRLRFVAAAVAALVVAAPVAHAQPGVQRPAAPVRSSRPALLGLLADAGVPDGANAALALRPADWLRLHAGGGTNTVSQGFRGGITFIPLGVGPSFSVDVGHYRPGDANALVRRLAVVDGRLEPWFRRLGYTYANLHAGLELGRGNLVFFVHGGVSYLRATLEGAQEAIDARGTGRADTTIVVGSDPVVRVWAPSAKLGLIAFLGGT